jgi:hypothetical protein
LGSTATFGAQTRRGLCRSAPFRIGDRNGQGINQEGSARGKPPAAYKQSAEFPEHSGQKAYAPVEGLTAGETGKPAGKEACNKIIDCLNGKREPEQSNAIYSSPPAIRLQHAFFTPPLYEYERVTFCPAKYLEFGGFDIKRHAHTTRLCRQTPSQKARPFGPRPFVFETPVSESETTVSESETTVSELKTTVSKFGTTVSKL